MNLTAELLDRRMAEHKRWQHDEQNRLLREVLDETAEALRDQAFYRWAKSKAKFLPFPESEPVEPRRLRL